MSISRRTRNSLSSLSDQDVQRLATHSSTVELSVTSSPQPAVSDSSSPPASSPPLSAATSSTQLLASSFCTTRLAQQLQTAPRPTTPSASDLLRAPSSLLLNSSVVRPPSSLPLPYVPPNTWPRASFAYVPSSMAFAPGVSTSGSSQVMLQSLSPPPSLFFQPSSAVQPVSQAPILPQSAVRAPHNSADNAFGRFPSDLRYPAVFDPASVITANVVPSSISSLGPTSSRSSTADFASFRPAQSRNA